MLEFLLPPGLLDAEPSYWYAVVRPMEFPARTCDGVPRRAAPGAEARVLVLEPAGEGAAGGAFVARYDAGLGYITDSWYPTREAAVADVEGEFADDLGPWTPVPEGEPDAERYVLGTVAERGAR